MTTLTDGGTIKEKGERPKAQLLEVTPQQAALIDWMRDHPHSRINLVIQDAQPVQALVPTDDGLGTQSVLFKYLKPKK